MYVTYHLQLWKSTALRRLQSRNYKGSVMYCTNLNYENIYSIISLIFSITRLEVKHTARYSLMIENWVVDSTQMHRIYLRVEEKYDHSSPGD